LEPDKLAWVHTGKQFRIKSPTIALDKTTIRKSMTLPVGAIVSVIDGPKPDVPLVLVVWQDRWLLVYEQDLHERADENLS
jgi:hypothetical protein